ncbi:MAG: DNA polymerase III subunit gamma/tau, partial [Thiomonas arsenitoxydans]|nr:DNA polymerase III subunit gamma/tau [Thiomonas arsenitoxydans]
LAAQLSPELVQLAYTTVLHGRNELSLAPDDRTGFTMTLLRLLAFAPVIAGSVPSLPPGGLALPKAAAPVSLPSQSAAAQVAAQREPPSAKPTAQTAAKAMPRTAATLSAPLAPAAPVLAAEEAPATNYAAQTEPKTQPQPTPHRPADIKPLQIAPHIASDTDWPTLVQRLDVPAGLPRALAQQSELVAMQGMEWLLRVPNEQLTRAGSLDKLQTAVRLALGRDIVLRAEAGEVTDSVMQRDARAKAQAQADAEAAIRNDPLVQQLMHDLGAQIVPGSLKPMPPSAQPTSA